MLTFSAKASELLNSQPLSVLLNKREMGSYFKRWCTDHSDCLCLLHATLNVLFCAGWHFLRLFLGTTQRTGDTMPNSSIGFGSHHVLLQRSLSRLCLPKPLTCPRDTLPGMPHSFTLQSTSLMGCNTGFISDTLE